MSEENLGPIKNEITFFMEKSFQFSFVYIGSIFASVAGVKVDEVGKLATALHTDTGVVLTTAILTFNVVYLVLASSCLFAILKRGYFILQYSSPGREEVIVNWEKFVRKPDIQFGSLGWNVDNYYMAVFYILIFIFSITVLIYGLTSTSVGALRIFFSILFALHALPTWVLIQTAKLDSACRALVRERKPLLGDQATS